MTLDHCYRINSPQVASEIIDGEVIMIDFEKGCYFSAEKLGAEIMQGIAAKMPVAVLIEQMAALHDVPRDEVTGIVATFIERLREEQLIVAEPISENVSASHQPRLERFAAAFDGGRLAVPTLHKYTDLQDLLLLDPIHDIDFADWPVANGEAHGPDE